MREKRPALLKAGPILLHDNATPDKSWHVMSVIDDYKCTENFETLCLFSGFESLWIRSLPRIKKKKKKTVKRNKIWGLRWASCCGQGGSMYLLWLPNNWNWRLTEPMERSHRMRGKLLRGILATVGFYNLLFVVVVVFFFVFFFCFFFCLFVCLFFFWGGGVWGGFLCVFFVPRPLSELSDWPLSELSDWPSYSVIPIWIKLKFEC